MPEKILNEAKSIGSDTGKLMKAASGHARVCIHACVCIYMDICVCIYICVYIYLCLYMCVYICISVYISLYIGTCYAVLCILSHSNGRLRLIIFNLKLENTVLRENSSGVSC